MKEAIISLIPISVGGKLVFSFAVVLILCWLYIIIEELWSDWAGFGRPMLIFVGMVLVVFGLIHLIV